MIIMTCGELFPIVKYNTYLQVTTLMRNMCSIFNLHGEIKIIIGLILINPYNHVRVEMPILTNVSASRIHKSTYDKEFYYLLNLK